VALPQPIPKIDILDALFYERDKELIQSNSFDVNLEERISLFGILQS
jgi:hypothetical protein